MNNLKVYITRTGHKMHFSENCRSLCRSSYLREATIQQAQYEGLTPCSICFSSHLLSSSSARNVQNSFQQRQHYYLNQTAISERIEEDSASDSTLSRFTENNKQIIQNDYSINDKSSGDNNNHFHTVSLNSESSFLNSKNNLQKDISNSINLFASFNIENNKKIKNQKELDISKEMNDSIIINKSNKNLQVSKEMNDSIIINKSNKKLQVSKEMNDSIIINKSNKKLQVSKEINASIIINKRYKTLQVSNEINNSIIKECKKAKIQFDKSIQTDKEKESNCILSNNKSQNIIIIDEYCSIKQEEKLANKNKKLLSIKSSKTIKIKDIDYYKDIDDITKDDLIEIPQKKEGVFFKTTLKPKKNNGQCRIGFEIMTLRSDNSVDEIESITKKYEIKEATIIAISCDMNKEQFYVKHKKKNETNWQYDTIKSIPADYKNKMIRPVIMHDEDDYYDSSISAFKTFYS